MKLLPVVILFLMVFQKDNYAQELDRCWPLGSTQPYSPRQEANLVFTDTTVRIDTIYRDFKAGRSCASISDGIGNMKFFTNGCAVANYLNDTMQNGDQLNPEPCSFNTCPNSGNGTLQGSLFLPDFLDTNKFILFHQTCDYNTNGSPIRLYTSMIDLALDSGRGGVYNKNFILFEDSLCDGSLAAVKHANGRDWWILLHEKYTNGYVRFLYSDTGIAGPYFQNIGLVFGNDGHGNSKFSPDGNWYATSNQLSGVDLYRFDRCTGILSENTYLDFPDSVWANCVEFSPDSRFLYTFWLLSVYQFDLTSTNIPSSGQLVATNDNFVANSNATFFFIPQLAPNGKIYISTLPSNAYLHVINFPNNLGVACDLSQHSISIPANNEILPYFPNYRLGALDSLYCDSVNSTANQQIENESISVFPNPSHEFISVSISRKNEFVEKYIIFNQLGKVIIHGAYNNSEPIDIRKFKSGLYFIDIVTNRGRYFKKFVVSNQ